MITAPKSDPIMEYQPDSIQTSSQGHCLCNECKKICVKKNELIEDIKITSPKKSPIGRPRVPKAIEDHILKAFRCGFGTSLREIARCTPPYYTKSGHAQHVGHTTVSRILKKHGLKPIRTRAKKAKNIITSKFKQDDVIKSGTSTTGSQNKEKSEHQEVGNASCPTSQGSETEGGQNDR